MFAWKLFYHALPLDDRVKGLASKCNCCNRPQMETLNHLFIHSDPASFLWNKVSSIFGLNLVSNEGLLSLSACAKV